MASETLLINADLVIGTGVSLVGGASATAVLGDDDLATYVRTSSSVTTNNITLDEGIRLGLPQPTIGGPITRIDVELIFEGYSDDAGGSPAIFLAFWGLTKADGFPLAFQFNGVIYENYNYQTKTAITDLSQVDIGEVEIWISTGSQILGTTQPTKIYELKVHVHNTEAAGYDGPMPPIPNFILTPPRRRFVFPY